MKNVVSLERLRPAMPFARIDNHFAFLAPVQHAPMEADCLCDRHSLVFFSMQDQDWRIDVLHMVDRKGQGGEEREFGL